VSTDIDWEDEAGLRSDHQTGRMYGLKAELEIFDLPVYNPELVHQQGSKILLRHR
jgi:hypothetical protein